MPHTELASANRVGFPRQRSASIAEINLPISAVVMNTEAALRFLLPEPTDAEAVRRLLVCIVEDRMLTGDVVHRSRALIKESAATEGMPGDQRCEPRGVTREERVMNAAGARDLLIRTVKTRSGSVLVAVRDSGPCVDRS
jgi:hypothetical protein